MSPSKPRGKPGRSVSRASSPPPESRARLAEAERRTQLLALGRELFAERSYDDIQIDDIAARAGISKGLLYHYFGSKRGYYVATIETAAAELLAATQADPALPPPERARSSMEAYLRFVSEHALAFKTLLRGGIGTDAEVAGIVDRVRAQFVDRFVTNLGLEKPRPVFALAARSWIGLVEAASLAWIENGDLDRATLLEFLMDTLTQVLLAAMRLDPTAPITLTPN